MPTKRIIIGFFVTIIVFTLIIFSSAPKFITYRDSDNWSEDYNKYCGYMFRCQYYPSGDLAIEVIQDEGNDDRDYYYTYHGLHCKNGVSVKSITANFLNSNDTLNFQLARFGKSLDYDAKIPQDIITSNQKIVLRIAFMEGLAEKKLILNRYVEKDYKYKDTQIFILLGVVIIILYLLWILLSYVLSKTFTQYSLLKCRTIAGIITVILSIIIIKIMLPIFLGC